MYFATAAFSFLLSHFAYYNCVVCTLLPLPISAGAVEERGLSIQPNCEKGEGAWQDRNF